MVLNSRVGEAVELGMLVPEIDCHENRAAGVRRGMEFRAIPPAQTAVIAHIEPVMSTTTSWPVLAVFNVKRALVDRERQSGGLVLNHERLVDIAGGVAAAHHPAMYYEVFAFEASSFQSDRTRIGRSE